jgi:hypothetical protein
LLVFSFSFASDSLDDCLLSQFNQKKFLIQSPAFLKKSIQVSFSSNDNDFLVQLKTSDT